MIYIHLFIYNIYTWNENAVFILCFSLLCKKSRKCGKLDRHRGPCDKNRKKENTFWENSPIQITGKLKNNIEDMQTVVDTLDKTIDIAGNIRIFLSILG